MYNVRRIARQLFAYGTADVMALAVNFLLLPVYMRVLSPVEYGALAMLLALEGVLKVVNRWGLITKDGFLPGVYGQEVIGLGSYRERHHGECRGENQRDQSQAARDLRPHVGNQLHHAWRGDVAQQQAAHNQRRHEPNDHSHIHDDVEKVNPDNSHYYEQREIVSRRLRVVNRPEKDKSQKSKRKHHTGKAEFFADDRKNEVRMAGRQES